MEQKGKYYLIDDLIKLCQFDTYAKQYILTKTQLEKLRDKK